MSNIYNNLDNLLDTSSYDYRQFIKTYQKAIELYSKGFNTKSSLKDCLDLVNSSCGYFHYCLIAYLLPLYSDTDYEHRELVFNLPESISRIKDKNMVIIKDYPEFLSVYSKLLSLYNDIKNYQLPEKLSPYERKEKVYKEKLNKLDRSLITDYNSYDSGIKAIVKMVDRIISPIYEQNVLKQVSLIGLSIDEIMNKYSVDKLTAKKLYMLVLDKSESDIRRESETLKKYELLDVEYKARRVINTNINSIELKRFEGNERSWIINGDHIFSIKIIIAGGWNIQRLHNRVLVKYRSIKE